MELDDVGSEELVGDAAGAACVGVDIMVAVLVELEAIVNCFCLRLTGCLKVDVSVKENKVMVTW
jgi:hypothetical protein